MRERMMDREVHPSDFERTESYFLKRFFGYVIDLALMMIISIFIFLIAGSDLGAALTWFLIIAVAGILLVLMKTATEWIKKESPGKFLVGLRVEPLGEDLSLPAAFLRNLTGAIPLLLPILDMAIGFAGSEDNRQKITDSISKTIVVENMPVVARELHRPIQMEPRERPEPFRLGFDSGYAKGNCPRCGAPYRVLPPGDERFNGLWNHRCTWCNYMIQEGV